VKNWQTRIVLDCFSLLKNNLCITNLQLIMNIFSYHSTVNKKLGCRWHATRSPEHLCASYSQHCILQDIIYWPGFPTRSHSPEGSSLQHIGGIFRLLPTPLPFDAINEVIPSSYRVHIWYGKTNGWATIWWRLHDTTHQRDRHIDTQPCCHSNGCPNTLHSGGKNRTAVQDCIPTITVIRNDISCNVLTVWCGLWNFISIYTVFQKNFLLWNRI